MIVILMMGEINAEKLRLLKSLYCMKVIDEGNRFIKLNSRGMYVSQKLQIEEICEGDNG